MSTGRTIQLTALLLTVASEGLGVAVLTQLAPSLRYRAGQTIVTTIGINLLVHPLFWYALSLARPASLTKLYLLELAVVVVEGALYRLVRGFHWWMALGLSLVLNVISLLAGIYFWPYAWS